MHASLLHEILSYVTGAQLHYIKLSTPAGEPPEHQRKSHKKQPDGPAAENMSKTLPAVLVDWRLSKPLLEVHIRVIRI